MDAIREIEAAVPISKLAQRATDLHEKGFMPWADADELALREQGLSEDALCDVVEDFPAVDHDGVSLMSPQDLKNFARHVLVWSPLESAKDQLIAAREAEIKRLKEHVEILHDALDGAEGHLSYTGYGDAWGRECAEAQGLPDKIEKALLHNQPDPVELVAEIPKVKTKRVACPHCDHRPRGADGLAAHINVKHPVLTTTPQPTE